MEFNFIQHSFFANMSLPRAWHLNMRGALCECKCRTSLGVVQAGLMLHQKYTMGCWKRIVMNPERNILESFLSPFFVRSINDGKSCVSCANNPMHDNRGFFFLFSPYLTYGTLTTIHCKLQLFFSNYDCPFPNTYVHFTIHIKTAHLNKPQLPVRIHKANNSVNYCKKIIKFLPRFIVF